MTASRKYKIFRYCIACEKRYEVFHLLTRFCPDCKAREDSSPQKVVKKVIAKIK